MAGERSSVAGGLLAFFAGFICVYFSGVTLFPAPIDLSPIANFYLLSQTSSTSLDSLLTPLVLAQLSSPNTYASLGNFLTVLTLLQYSSPTLYASYGNLLISITLLQLPPSVLSGGLWNILGLVFGAGILLLAYPLAAGKGTLVATVGLIGLGALEIITGFAGKQILIVIGGVLAIIAAVFGVIVWRAVKTEVPKAKVEAKKVVKAPAKAKGAKPPKKAKPVAAEAAAGKAPRPKMEVIRVEGIGPVYGARLQKEKIITITDLAKASADKVASVAQINPQKAQKWIQIADLLLIEAVDENAAELMVMGADVASRKDLANKNPDKLYDQLQSALKMGKVPVPKGWSFTKNDVQKWINAAKGK